VIIETAYAADPPAGYNVLLITSTGSVGEPNVPAAQYQIKAEMTWDPPDPPPAAANPRHCHYTHWQDQTAP
jgi:hypothetical protein